MEELTAEADSPQTAELGTPPEQTPLETAAGQASGDAQLKAAIEAIVYVAEEPATAAQIASALREPEERVKRLLEELLAEYNAPARGVTIREIAGGYRMATKPEHHDAVRAFAKSLKPPLKLSLAALETLSTIAYKQPVTAPEIMEIRGVQGAGVLKTLLDRKLIQTAGRKNVVGRPILYKTSKEFLLHFGLKDLTELPTLKEFEELRRLALTDEGVESLAIEEPVAGEPEAGAGSEEQVAGDQEAGAAAEGAPERSAAAIEPAPGEEAES
jgi:segregation and condensation protein B